MPNYKALNENLNIEKKNVLSKQKKTYGEIIYYNELVVFLNDFNTFANIKDFSVYFTIHKDSVFYSYETINN